MLVRMAIAQRIAPHSNKISGPKSCPIRNSTRVSMRLPKATRMVENVNGMPAIRTSEMEIARSWTMPQVLGSW